MPNKRKVEAKLKETSFLKDYGDPSVSGSLGGVQRFARDHKLPLGKVQETLERDLGYTLHKPRRRHFPTLPVMVFGIDEQWAADLIEVIKYCQIQSRLQVSIDSDRRVFQIRLGGTCQVQDRTRRDDCFREEFETKSRSNTSEATNR